MRSLAVAIGLLIATAMASAAPPALPPRPTHWVTDNAELLDAPTRDGLDAKLEAYERATGRQVLVWIGTSLSGAALEDFTVRAFTAWGVGQKGLDNGVVLFVFVKDRVARIEVGYGLEGRFPDVYGWRIIEDTLAPALRAGTPGDGLTKSVDQIIGHLDSVPDAKIERAPPPSGRHFSVLEMIAIVVLLVLVIGFAITHPRAALWLLWNIASSTSNGGSSGGGGGGRDGFSGGGGRSGGGGASGSW